MIYTDTEDGDLAGRVFETRRKQSLMAFLKVGLLSKIAGGGSQKSVTIILFSFPFPSILLLRVIFLGMFSFLSFRNGFACSTL
jgi:hypothetical protein